MRETFGMTLGGLSRSGEAIPHLERSLELRVAELGEEDVDTLRTKLELCAYLLGDRGEALAKEALQGLQATLGPDDRETLTAAHTLALRWADEAARSLPNFTRALEVQALAQLRAGEHADAGATLEGLPETSSAAPLAEALRVLVHTDPGEWEAAEVALERARDGLTRPPFTEDFIVRRWVLAVAVQLEGARREK